MTDGKPKVLEALTEFIAHQSALRLGLTPSKHLVHLRIRRPLVWTPTYCHTPAAGSRTALSATRHTALSPGSPSPKWRIIFRWSEGPRGGRR
jgi:hypothetical protein